MPSAYQNILKGSLTQRLARAVPLVMDSLLVDLQFPRYFASDAKIFRMRFCLVLCHTNASIGLRIQKTISLAPKMEFSPRFLPVSN